MSAHHPSKNPEKVKDWVLFFGFGSAVLGLVVVGSFFGSSPATPVAGEKTPVPVRNMRRTPTMPVHHVGDFASRSNSAHRDTNQPIEVRATLSGTLQRPQ